MSTKLLLLLSLTRVAHFGYCYKLEWILQAAQKTSDNTILKMKMNLLLKKAQSKQIWQLLRVCKLVSVCAHVRVHQTWPQLCAYVTIVHTRCMRPIALPPRFCVAFFVFFLCSCIHAKIENNNICPQFNFVGVQKTCKHKRQGVWASKWAAGKTMHKNRIVNYY